MSENKMPGWQSWAQFRFAVIGGLLSSPPESGELQQALQALAEQSYQHPVDPEKRIRLSFATIERWYYHARKAPDPIAVLGRKRRMDAGRRLCISDELLAPSTPNTTSIPAGAFSCTMTTCAPFLRATAVGPGAELQDRSALHARKRLAASL